MQTVLEESGSPGAALVDPAADLSSFDLLVGTYAGGLGPVALERAIEARVDLLDLADIETHVYDERRAAVERRGIAVYPAAGFCPGLVNVLLQRELARGGVARIEVLAGTLAPVPNYFPFLWCFEDMVLEFDGPSVQVQGGVERTFPPFAGQREETLFGVAAESYLAQSGFEQLTRRAGLTDFTYRNLRPAGFRTFFEFLRAHGAFEPDVIAVTKALLERRLHENISLAQITVEGAQRRRWLVSARARSDAPLNSMQRITAACAAAFVTRLRSIDRRPGVHWPEEFGTDEPSLHSLLSTVQQLGVSIELNPPALWIGSVSSRERDFDLTLERCAPGGSFVERGGPALALLREPVLRREGDAVIVTSRDGTFRVREPGGRCEVSVSCPGGATRALRFFERLALEYLPESVALVTRRDNYTAPYRHEGLIFTRSVAVHQSAYQRIEIAEHPVYGRLLMLDGEVSVSEYDEALYSRTLRDVGRRSTPRRVCILGGGDCGVLRAVLEHRSVEAVVMVELDPEVVRMCSEHLPAIVSGADRDARATIVYDDAFAFLERTDARFDEVIYDLSDTPIGSVSDEQLVASMRRALAPGGRIAIQCGGAADWNRGHRERVLAALRAGFATVEVERVVIPSFNEGEWVFAGAC
ncbi:MAG: hypothetical protein KC636_14770 [Myxococcales bacterium]|nr:hypothetical protein [Myxococcales bacterium]